MPRPVQRRPMGWACQSLPSTVVARSSVDRRDRSQSQRELNAADNRPCDARPMASSAYRRRQRADMPEMLGCDVLAAQPLVRPPGAAAQNSWTCDRIIPDEGDAFAARRPHGPCAVYRRCLALRSPGHTCMHCVSPGSARGCVGWCVNLDKTIGCCFRGHA